MAVWPSKRQRQLADYRDRARRAGLSVSLKSPGELPPRLQRTTDDPLVGYGLRLTPRQRQKVNHDLFVRSPRGWEAKSGSPIPAFFDRLPENAEIVSVGWDEITIYWNESGGDEALNAVLMVLVELHPQPPNAQTLTR